MDAIREFQTETVTNRRRQSVSGGRCKGLGAAQREGHDDRRRVGIAGLSTGYGACGGAGRARRRGFTARLAALELELLKLEDI
jgi:hypothetical protein